MQTGEHGLIHLKSLSSVSETVERLDAILRSKNVAVMARIDHAANAEKVGLQMAPTELLMFGNPTAGTPLMIASPSSAIDLPLKALVWQDEAGQVWLSYNTPEYLGERHGIPASLLYNIAGIHLICAEAVR